jgi:glucose/mannose-6-phosphate isomerase
MSAADPLSRDAIAAADPQGMLGDVLSMPHQLGDALWRSEAAGVPRRHMPGGLVVCGMGGSAIGGDLARSAIGSRARLPLRVVRGYELVPWMAADALVVCASYSGNTEETLACWQAAGEIGAPRVAVTTGGELARLAREVGAPVIGVPSGMQPRAAVAYMTVATLECAAAAGVSESLRPEVEAAGTLLTQLVDEWGPDAAPDSQAKSLARALDGTIPVVYGGGITAGVAGRWKTQINENAKSPGYAAVLPEADHNDIVGWERAPGLARMSAIFLDDDGIHPRIRRRIELTARLVADGAVTVQTLRARGQSAVERIMSLVLLGDVVTVYMAVLAGVDPTPVEVLERLKGQLASS